MNANGGTPAYRRPELDVDRRVEDLLDRMTVAEKAGQLVGTWGGKMGEHHTIEDVREAVTDYGLGAAATFGWGGAIGTTPGEIVDTVNEIQELAIEETRLGIPVLFNVDAVHGHAYVAGSAVFPNGLGTGATWDPERAERAADVCATEVRATGAHQNYSPTCDVGREPRWGRVFETFGESPRLVGEMAAAKVRGYQGDGIGGDGNVVATAKHFPAYSEPERGEDASPAEISEYRLWNTFLRSFESVIDEGVESVMPSYNATNGEPIHGSRRYLTDLLRGELGFDGHVVSDWGGVRHLHEDHRVTRDWRESVHRTRTAGLDVASVGTTGHVDHLVDLVEAGDLAESSLDEKVRRVLRVKFRMGLFEDPFVDRDEALETVGHEDHRAAARDAARASMTLLKNDDLLPLDGSEDVFVAGPNADDTVHQVGGWSVDEEEHVAGDSLLDALAQHAEGAVTYEQGATLNEELDVDAAAEKAADADVAVVALGEGWYLHEFGPQEQAGVETGEWPHRSNLRLSDAQRELVRAIHETGTPTVGVLITGRPLIVDWMAEHVPAILMAYYPGSEGGHAIAETLFGDNEPSGRLPITVPRDEGDLPQRHDYQRHPRPIGDDEHPPSYDPLYPFGHGLSYTDFEYRNVDVLSSHVGPGDDVELEVTLANVGDRDGTEVVQAYCSQESPRRVRPASELLAFERVSLDAGEKRTVDLTVPASELGYYRPGDGHVVEADTYEVTVDEHAVDVELDGTYL